MRMFVMPIQYGLLHQANAAQRHKCDTYTSWLSCRESDIFCLSALRTQRRDAGSRRQELGTGNTYAMRRYITASAVRAALPLTEPRTIAGGLAGSPNCQWPLE